MSCNGVWSVSPGAPLIMFQSLSGFPMSCNLATVSVVLLDILVSIPIGFSNELQRIGRLRDRVDDQVSIPIGFSNELQRGST